MRIRNRLFLFLMGAALLGAPAAISAEDLNSAIAKLNAAASRFKSTSADFQFEAVTTEPIPDTEVQTGTVYYERNAKNAFRVSAHIRQVNGRPVPKSYVYSSGTFKLWEGGNLDQVTTFTKATKFESYLMLGFGASGKDLEEKWNLKFDGDETVDGVKTAKLELIAKDPEVRKNFPKVIVWMDLDRGVSLKQYFDEGQGQSRTCKYTNFKMNQSLPSDAFTFKTDKDTRFINR